MSNNAYRISNAEVLTSNSDIRYTVFDINSLNLIALGVSLEYPALHSIFEGGLTPMTNFFYCFIAMGFKPIAIKQ
jgi:hypothetical protein